jgi:hypothetical protein
MSESMSLYHGITPVNFISCELRLVQVFSSIFFDRGSVLPPFGLIPAFTNSPHACCSRFTTCSLAFVTISFDLETVPRHLNSDYGTLTGETLFLLHKIEARPARIENDVRSSKQVS